MRSVPSVVLVSMLGLAACAPPGSSAFVSANVPLNADCSPGEGNVGISTGSWDVLSNGTKKTNCERAYSMSLFINSNLQANNNTASARAEPNTLLVMYADVSLLDNNEALLSFNPLDDRPRPNPYRVHTAISLPPTDNEEPSTGWVQIEAIPSIYGQGLRAYSGESILVEVSLFGTTTGDVPVDFLPFVFPLAICSDCLSTCRADPKWAGEGAAVLAELNADECNDRRPQDGRICIDDGC